MAACEQQGELSRRTCDAPSSCLVFSADFECGNLSEARQVSEQEWDLLIQHDTLSPR
jgi:hypothetical protein